MPLCNFFAKKHILLKRIKQINCREIKVQLPNAKKSRKDTFDFSFFVLVRKQFCVLSYISLKIKLKIKIQLELLLISDSFKLFWVNLNLQSVLLYSCRHSM